MKTLERLQALNVAVIAQVVPGLRLHTVTVDVDEVVVATGLQVEPRVPGLQPASPEGPER